MHGAGETLNNIFPSSVLEDMDFDGKSIPDMPNNLMLQLEHFSQPAFRKLVRALFPHFAANSALYPDLQESAKVWEIANCLRALANFNCIRPDSEILGIAAGSELTIYWLTNYVRRVFATDLYGTNAHWQEASAGMMFEPENLAPPGMLWNPKRLVVQHMDALNLRYEDNSFDAIFSCGSIEHFGCLENVTTAIIEMARVLKPGGVAALATEFRISGPADGFGVPGALIFTPEMIQEFVVRPSGLTLVDEPAWSTTPETVKCVYPLAEAIEKGTRQRSIAVSHDDYSWTSGTIVLRK